jgi:hypothetical protein
MRGNWQFVADPVQQQDTSRLLCPDTVVEGAEDGEGVRARGEILP